VLNLARRVQARLPLNRASGKNSPALPCEEIYEKSSLDVDRAGIAAAHVFRWSYADEFSIRNRNRRREKRERVSEGNTVKGSYQLAVGGQHPAATVGVTGAYLETDVKCFDGSSYTLTVPMPEGQTYTVPAKSHLFVPGPSVYQGSATAPACSGGASHGVITGAYFSALGLANGVGNPPLGNGFTTTDTTDPLSLSFSCSANGIPSNSAAPTTINFQQ
jgi:hypothetical protein